MQFLPINAMEAIYFTLKTDADVKPCISFGKLFTCEYQKQIGGPLYPDEKTLCIKKQPNTWYINSSISVYFAFCILSAPKSQKSNAAHKVSQ